MTDDDVAAVTDRAGEQAVDALSALFGETSPGTVFSAPERAYRQSLTLGAP